jgi:hypothetical protein
MGQAIYARDKYNEYVEVQILRLKVQGALRG